MRRAPRHWHSVARSAVTALLGAALVLLGGADAAEARPWAAGAHCVTAQQAPAGERNPSRCSPRAPTSAPNPPSVAAATALSRCTPAPTARARPA